MQSTFYELQSPLKLVTKDLELDESHLGDGKICAETEYTAVSPGTECAAWLGKPPLRPSTTYPRLVGYCNLARVKTVGPRVEHLRAGDYVLTHQSHRTSFICDASDVLLRLSDEDAGNTETRKRLTATYLYHVGYMALLAGGYQPGHQVAIVGLGTLGITTASLLKAFGAEPLLFTDQEAGRRKLQKMGCTRMFGKVYPSQGFASSLFGMGGVDICLNTSNLWSDHLLSMQLARKGGTVVCVGFPGRGEALPDFNPLDSQYLFDKQLLIKHCGMGGELDFPALDVRFTLKRNMEFLASLIVAGRVDPHDVLSLQGSWDQLHTVYESLASHKPGLYSALLKWND